MHASTIKKYFECIIIIIISRGQVQTDRQTGGQHTTTTTVGNLCDLYPKDSIGISSSSSNTYTYLLYRREASKQARKQTRKQDRQEGRSD